MTMLRIAEVARRSGFSPTALRYYEELGLLAPPERTAAGYRLYAESVLARLAFVARAKEIGCSLSEIAELLPAWEGGACRPLQDGLGDTARGRLAEVEARIDDLAAFAGELRRLLGAFDAHTSDGACDDGCGCLAAPAGVDIVACTLDERALANRMDEWRAVLAGAGAPKAVDGGVRLALGDTVPLADLARVIGAEQSCCPFLSFTLTVDGRGATLEVRAPAGAAGVVEALLAAASHGQPAWKAATASSMLA